MFESLTMLEYQCQILQRSRSLIHEVRRAFGWKKADHFHKWRNDLLSSYKVCPMYFSMSFLAAITFGGGITRYMECGRTAAYIHFNLEQFFILPFLPLVAESLSFLEYLGKRKSQEGNRLQLLKMCLQCNQYLLFQLINYSYVFTIKMNAISSFKPLIKTKIELVT